MALAVIVGAIGGRIQAGRRGSQVYATGFGLATSDGTESGIRLANGTVTPLTPADGSVLHRLVTPLAVTVGGLFAETVFAGLAPGYAGLYQINIRIPAAARPGDAVALEITGRIGTQNISDRAMISIAAP